ncbi:MAG TPA: group II intron reverse transcriptase/maturase [Thermoguttaceae bacterium]|nr:group II intron reverse transcriptase/maturase [Thermoguttaceae bacterium]
MPETPNSENVSTRQQRIAMLAKQSPQMAFTALNHYLDLDWLREAFHRTRKDGAVGVDGQTWAEYAENLEDNLQSLLDRAKSGTYRAPPVRRVYIPKGTGKETRPIGIPTLEDKLLQRAVVMVLEAIYEQDFYDGSYGFRPGRSAHQALESLWTQTMKTGGGWILEVDIRKFFDTLDHGHLRAFLRRRVRDGVLLRLIGKWLNAGVLEEGSLSYPDAGSPQGGVISPILANVFLHYVLDEWFAGEVQPRLRGRAFLIRYADDFVIGFTRDDDARRVMDVLPKRFGKYGLTIHPDKTKLVPFRRPSYSSSPQGGPRGDRPGTFDLLGFTHYWSRSRKGNWVVKRKTAASRFTRAVRTIAHWCRLNRHHPLGQQHAILSQKLHGHYAYYGITGNSVALSRFREEVRRVWRKWLVRRRGGNRRPWSWFVRLQERYRLPYVRTIHSVCRLRSEGVT